jgi:hypothetical protein
VAIWISNQQYIHISSSLDPDITSEIFQGFAPGNFQPEYGFRKDKRIQNYIFIKIDVLTYPSVIAACGNSMFRAEFYVLDTIYLTGYHVINIFAAKIC